MNARLKCYLIILVHTIIGLAILISLEAIRTPGWLNASFILFIAFLFVNLANIRIFKLQQAAKEFWDPSKLPYLLYGFIAGLIISGFPVIVGVLALPLSDISLDTDLSITSIGLTLMIVVWEELWFRGSFLNYCNRHLSVRTLAITMGLLFMLIHIFNPGIDLLRTGPSLFFAGGLLTLLYLYYGNIWVCIGLHFGNNFLSSRLSLSTPNIIFDNDGHLYTILLGILFFVFFFKRRHKIARI